VIGMSAEEDLSALSYEHARDELLEVVRRLEGGGTTLEDSLALWERGEALARVCQDWLDGARARIEAAKAADPQAASPSEDNVAAKPSSSA